MTQSNVPVAPARLLLVEDDPVIAECLATELRLDGFEVRVEADGLQGLLAARQSLPDLIILDLMLPNLNGVEICQRLRHSSDVPIIMLTALDSVADRVEGLNAGANDYVRKPFALQELIARINSQLRAHSPSRHSQLTFSELRIDIDAREAWRGERTLKLTQKEFDLFHFLMEHPRQVKTREQILQVVWGYDFDGENNVVDVYISYLRAKVTLADEAPLIHTVRGVGYVLREAG